MFLLPSALVIRICIIKLLVQYLSILRNCVSDRKRQTSQSYFGIKSAARINFIWRDYSILTYPPGAQRQPTWDYDTYFVRRNLHELQREGERILQNMVGKTAVELGCINLKHITSWQSTVSWSGQTTLGREFKNHLFKN